MLKIDKVKSQLDIEAISALAGPIFSEVYGKFVSKSHIDSYLQSFQAPDAIRKQLANNYTYYTIRENGILIGYFALVYYCKRIELSKLYLKKSARGKGIGHEIIEWIIDHAEEADVSRVELFVLRQNNRAIKFYERQGFYLRELVAHHFETGDYEENYKMVLKVSSRTVYD